MRKCREWVVDRSQNMGPNCGEFLDILGQSVAVGELVDQGINGLMLNVLTK